VWGTAGSCSRLTSSKLIEMLKSIQVRSKLAPAEFDRRRAKKPICEGNSQAYIEAATTEVATRASVGSIRALWLKLKPVRGCILVTVRHRAYA
jgi:hypothetical protein